MIGSILRKRNERRRRKLKEEFVGRLRKGKDYGKVYRTKPPAR